MFQQRTGSRRIDGCGERRPCIGDLPMDFPCQYCRTRCPTSQGLRTHLALSEACRIQHHQKFSGDSDSESDSAVFEEPTMDHLSDPEDSMHEDDYLEGSDEETYHPSREESPPGQADALAPPAGTSDSRKRPRATVEEVEDEDARWFQLFPKDRAAGALLEKCQTQFEKLREEKTAAGRAPWEPFESEDEWELARWLVTSGTSQTKVDEFLKLKKVKEGIDPSFHNNRALLQRIDALPQGPTWECYPFELVGDELGEDGKLRTEILEIWHRDPVECVRELLGN
ncbi:hypothetical protein B0H11DRAFT_2317943, partial [Mycena galericulata]